MTDARLILQFDRGFTQSYLEPDPNAPALAAHFDHSDLEVIEAQRLAAEPYGMRFAIRKTQ